MQVSLCPGCHGIEVSAFPLPLLPMEAMQQQPSYGVALHGSQVQYQLEHYLYTLPKVKSCAAMLSAPSTC